ncbi:phosphoglycolate phosphatase [Halodurantibacterium flavum]|uniref:Phosphoglycolate phosphatase n=1 Tax=Halodurantibacterium flavum TaxID=1382802 RepID=A0ABW4S2Z1_9RHOB
MTAVIFDLDGTLVDSVPDIHRCVTLALAGEGLPPLSLPVVRGFVGNGAPILIERVIGAAGLPQDAGTLARVLGRFLDHYEDAVGLTTLYPGVADCLRRLADAEVPMALCTNKPLAPTRNVLAHFDLTAFFPIVVAGDSLPVKKPDPAPLRQAMADLGTSRAIFVGDSEVDAETASRAGVPFGLFTQGYRRTPVEALPHSFAFDGFETLAPRIMASRVR